jgi:hypothetical protein
MKNILFLPITMLIAGCALAEPASLKFTVRVLDSETGIPVTNAIVQSFFEHQYDPWGNKPNIIKQEKVLVDENGEAVFSGKDLNGGIGGSAVAEGYYDGRSGRASERKNILLNRWEPWNPVIEVKMRPKKNPVSMVYKRIERKQIPLFDTQVGFDLEIADWVSPYGKGKICDFVFTASTNMAQKQGIHYILSFPNNKDGIQPYMLPQGLHSSFVWPYKAPEDGYESGLDKYFIFHFPKIDGPPFHNVKDDKDINYIFRTRTQFDDNGNMVAGCHGRIQGEVRISSKGEAYFQYWFNPDPFSRSLEYNGENLLKK